jgi:hypothetical protein
MFPRISISFLKLQKVNRFQRSEATHGIDESLTAVRGKNKKNHIGQMWWIKCVVEMIEIKPVK